MKKTIVIAIMAVLVLIAGNYSRPYPAFGGEELAFMALLTWAALEAHWWRKEKKCIR